MSIDRTAPGLGGSSAAQQSVGDPKAPWWLGIRNPNDGALPINVVKRATWYEANMRSARIRSQVLEVSVLVLTSATPLAVAVNAPTWVPALLGALAAVVTGLRHIFGWQKNWIAFARTSSQIEAEIVKYGAGIDPYDTAGRAAAQLSGRVEAIVGRETDDWSRRAEGKDSDSPDQSGSATAEEEP